MPYYHKRKILLPFEEAVEKTKSVLTNEGFGIMSEIDVKAVMHKKLNQEFGKYVILGACHAPSAHKALMAEKDIGLLMPCNVVVYEDDGMTYVAAVRPTVTMQIVGNPKLASIGAVVEAKLKKVVDSV